MMDADGAFAFFDAQPPDPKVPSWDGQGGAAGLEMYERQALAYVLGIEPTRRDQALPRLWANLRGDAKRAVNRLKINELQGEAGWKLLFDALRARYPDSQLKRLPRL